MSFDHAKHFDFVLALRNFKYRKKAHLIGLNLKINKLYSLKISALCSVALTRATIKTNF